MGTRGRPIVARESELELVHRFIGDIRVGPASLTIEGHAGIGKTSIWEQSLSQARTAGVMVRECRCSQSDATLAFAGLGDLFDNLYPAVLDRLPDVQRSALSAALLLSDLEGQQAGVRVVGVAVLGVLRELAGSAPLLRARLSRTRCGAWTMKPCGWSRRGVPVCPARWHRTWALRANGWWWDR
jgi:hypothetical protein